MAHEFETGFFVGNQAWHGLGNLLEKPPETIVIAMKEAGLDWQVKEKHIFVPSVNCAIDPNDGLTLRLSPGVGTETDFVSLPSDDDPMLPSEDLTWISGYKALVRSTDNRVLGIVSRKYRPLQNTEAFGFFDGLLDEKTCTLEAAGSLRGGRRIWVLAKVNGIEGDVGQNDIVKSYLLLWNSHDATTVVGCQFTAIRVVCMNTLRMAQQSKGIVKIRHSTNILESLKTVKNAVDLTARNFSLSLDEYKLMKARKLDIEGLKAYVRKVFVAEEPVEGESETEPGKVPEGKIELARASEFEEARKELASTKGRSKDWLPRSYKDILDGFYQAPGANLAGQTVWGAYNSVTHYLDYVRGDSDATRLDSTWFGSSEKLRGKAHAEAMALARA